MPWSGRPAPPCWPSRLPGWSLYAAYGGKEALFLEATALYSRVEGADIWLALEKAPTARLAIERCCAGPRRPIRKVIVRRAA
ncbi:hypothetical protein X741_24055 [Mesorhizobium sp. LNHC229A00]|nr:hypothetical protein X741_24055 [Mesorhizobium sp. LNHC229A00]